MTEKLHAIYYNQALQDIRELKLEEGRRKLIKAITFDNNQAAAWNLLGLIYYRIGKLRSAAYCWNKSLELNSEDNAAAEYLKECEKEIEIIEPSLHKLYDLIKANDFKKAKKVIYEVPNQISNKVDILNFFGLIMIINSDIESARDYWMKSLNIAVDGMAPIYLSNSIELKNTNYLKTNLLKYLKRKLRI